jgi:DNA-binding CsgD family transcriptional regulator
MIETSSRQINVPLSPPSDGRPNEKPAAYLLITNEAPEVWHASIGSRRKVIGRRQDCDIVVPAKFVCTSRRHAEIWADRSAIKIRDLGSTGGTRVNGVGIERAKDVKIVPGDRISLGGLELVLVDDIPIAGVQLGESGVRVEESVDRAKPDDLAVELSRALLARLSQAELAIVLWLCRGFYKDEEIASKLNRSPNTIRTQVNSIFKKLAVHSRNEIVSLVKRSDPDGVSHAMIATSLTDFRQD